MSDILARKTVTYFRRFDHKNVGFVTLEDFKSIGRRFGEREEIGRERRKTAKLRFIQLFKSYADIVEAKDDRLDEKQFIESLNKLRKDPTYDDFTNKVLGLVYIAFVILDDDGDGFIDQKNYIRFFYNLGFNDHETLAKAAFEKLDVDHDGKVGFDEFRVDFTDFLLSPDESRPGTYVLGPMIE